MNMRRHKRQRAAITVELGQMRKFAVCIHRIGASASHTAIAMTDFQSAVTLAGKKMHENVDAACKKYLASFPE